MRPVLEPIIKPDPIDRRILTEFQADGGLNHAELALRVGSSTASCWRRIKRLEAAVVLAATVRLVDAGKVGCSVNVLCNLRVKNHGKNTRSSFEDFVRTRVEVMEYFSMSGKWDYLLRVVASDVSK